MPLPTTWHPVSEVGTARGQGSRVAPRSDPKVGGLFRCGPLEQRKVCSLPVREVQRADVRGFPEVAAAASLTRQTHGDRARQRQIPPCRASGPSTQETPESTDLALFAALQSAVGAYRTSLEARSSHGYAQPFLRNAGRNTLRNRHLLRSLAKTKLRIAKIMRHYLRRYV